MSDEAKTTPTALDAFLGILRKNGVRRWAGVVDADHMEVEFHPIVESTPLTINPEPKGTTSVEDLKLMEVDAGTCSCSHDMLMHNSEGECLRGCAADVCAKGMLTPAPE